MRTYLEGNIQGSVARAYHGEAGWIIEIIHPQLGTQQRPALLARIETLLNNVPATIQKDIVWKLFLYSSTNERFKDFGTLHTNPQEHDQSGMPIITLGAHDAYVDLTEYDCEIISFNSYNGLQMSARVSLNDQGHPILPFNPNVTYLWLEALGGHYGVQTVAQGAAPGELTIVLRG